MSTKRTIDIDINTNADQAAKQFETLATGVNKAANSADNLDAKFEDVFQGIEPLTTRLGEAEDRLYELALAGDTTSREYQELLTKVGQYRKVQIQTDIAVDAAATTLSQKLGGALTGATSGFAAIQGAMGLVSTESEELNEVLLRVQSALALSQGVQGVRDAIPAFKQLFNTIKVGIGSTGIGLLVVALGALVANFDKIKAAISGVTDEQKALNAESKKNVETQKQNLETLNGQENVLKLQGKSEREILQMKIKQTDAVIETIKANIENDKITTRAQVEQLERSQEMAETIARVTLQIGTSLLRVFTKPLDLLLDGVSEVSKFLGFGELTTFRLTDTLDNLIDKGAEAVSTFLFDPEEAQAESNAAIAEQEKTLETLRNNRAGFLLSIKAMNKAQIKSNKEKNEQIRKDNAELLDTEIDEEIELQRKFDQIKRENEDRLRTDEQNELLLVKEKYDKLKAMAQGNADALNEIEIARLNESNDIKLKFNNDEDLEDNKKRADAKALADYRVQVATQSLSAISDIAELFSKGNEKQAKRAFQIQKAVGIAQATINTAQAITKVFAETTDFTPTQSLRVANAVAIGLAGAAQVASIASQQFQGGGTGGTDVSVDTATQAPQFNVVGDSSLNQIAQLQQEPVQAFVVSGEVTTAQALDRNRVQNATL
jgi:hypothetical protein